MTDRSMRFWRDKDAETEDMRDRARLIIDSGDTDVTEEQMMEWDLDDLKAWLDLWAKDGEA